MNINYKKLPYEQYFIDTSNDVNNTGRRSFKIEYKTVNYVYNGILAHANYCVRYDNDRNVIQVHFEGTRDIPDWFTNLLFQPKYYESFIWENKKITLRVHKSWQAMYKVLKHYIRSDVSALLKSHPESEVEVIGWSLGSAMAMLCTQDLNYNLNIKSHLFTFGSVNLFKTNVFNRRKTLKYLKSTTYEYHIFTSRNDIVSYLVPRLFGFIKLGRINLGKFNLFGLFNIRKYHYIYDRESLYKKLYKREKRN